MYAEVTVCIGHAVIVGEYVYTCRVIPNSILPEWDAKLDSKEAPMVTGGGGAMTLLCPDFSGS